MTLPQSAEICTRHANGAPDVVQLVAPATLGSGAGGASLVPCAAGIIHLHPDGALAFATLGAPCTVGGVAFAAGDDLAFDEAGRLRRIGFHPPREFATRCDVSGVVLDDRGAIETLVSGDSFYDATGSLVRRHLRAPETIDGIVCGPGLAAFEKGRLKAAVLGAPLATPYGPIPAGSSVSRFDADGAPQEARIGRACVLGGSTFAAGDPVRFGPDGPAREGWTFYTPVEPVR